MAGELVSKTDWVGSIPTLCAFFLKYNQPQED